MLTSHPEWQGESLGQGAIAFVVKPWDNNALDNQIRATLGAVAHIRQETTPEQPPRQLGVRDIRIDMQTFRVIKGETAIDLTPIEFALLVFFVRHPNRHWTREELLNRVWDDSWAGYERTVERHVAALRRKLKLERNERIETVHGGGLPAHAGVSTYRLLYGVTRVTWTGLLWLFAQDSAAEPLMTLRFSSGFAFVGQHPPARPARPRRAAGLCAARYSTA